MTDRGNSAASRDIAYHVHGYTNLKIHQDRGPLIITGGDGSREDVEYGSWFRSMNGPDMASAGVHTTVAMPGATGASSGFPDSRDAGGAYVMAGGTTEAHLMVPSPRKPRRDTNS